VYLNVKVQNKTKTINKRRGKYLTINYWSPDIADLEHVLWAVRTFVSELITTVFLLAVV
jgi:hypothetical protein